MLAWPKNSVEPTAEVTTISTTTSTGASTRISRTQVALCEFRGDGHFLFIIQKAPSFANTGLWLIIIDDNFGWKIFKWLIEYRPSISHRSKCSVKSRKHSEFMMLWIINIKTSDYIQIHWRWCVFLFCFSVRDCSSSTCKNQSIYVCIHNTVIHFEWYKWHRRRNGYSDQIDNVDKFKVYLFFIMSGTQLKIERTERKTNRKT